ncbi:unnamed protein product, partial [Polarella glacialis]
HVSEHGKSIITAMLMTNPRRRITTQQIRLHPWLSLAADPERSLRPAGPELDIVEEDVLEELTQFGIPLDYARSCLLQNKHNQITTTYHLLVQRKRRMIDKVMQSPYAQVVQHQNLTEDISASFQGFQDVGDLAPCGYPTPAEPPLADPSCQ